MSDRDSGEMILAFVLGGVIGAALGILYAPRPGKETREALRNISDDLADRLETLGEEVKEKTEHAVSEGKEKLMSQKERLEAAYDAGKKVFKGK